MHNSSAPQSNVGDVSLVPAGCQGPCSNLCLPFLSMTPLGWGEGTVKGGAAPAVVQGGTAGGCEEHPRLGGTAQPSPLAAGASASSGSLSSQQLHAE